MSYKKIFTMCILIFILVTTLAACGSDSENSSDEKTATLQAVDQLQADQEVTVTEALPEADTKATEDNLIGSWVDITSPDRFVNITKNGSEYQYEDNEGKYPATFQDGKLKVKVSETDTADAYIDGATGNLLSVYQDNISEFSKK